MVTRQGRHHGPEASSESNPGPGPALTTTYKIQYIYVLGNLSEFHHVPRACHRAKDQQILIHSLPFYFDLLLANFWKSQKRQESKWRSKNGGHSRKKSIIWAWMIVSNQKMTAFFLFKLSFIWVTSSRHRLLALSNSKGVAEKRKGTPIIFNVCTHQHV